LREAELLDQVEHQEQQVRPAASVNSSQQHTNQPAPHSARGSTSGAALQQSNESNYENQHNSGLPLARNIETPPARIAYATNSVQHVSKTEDSAFRIVWFEQTKRPLAKNSLIVESEHLASAHRRRHIDQQPYPMEQQAQKLMGFLVWAIRL